LNVGAGTGNYEPSDRPTIALEPSAVMIALALSNLHHWSDLAAGLTEMSRVAARRVVYFSEPSLPGMFWLADDYFPPILSMSINNAAPSTERVIELLGGNCEVHTFEVPRDFAEASAGAFWARPEAYCDPAIQAAMSMFALLEPSVVETGVARLRADLVSGAWDRRYGHLRQQDRLDLGIASSSRTPRDRCTLYTNSPRVVEDSTTLPTRQGSSSNKNS
jgi:hypothetical protein